jgi:hypothetical protein
MKIKFVKFCFLLTQNLILLKYIHCCAFLLNTWFRKHRGVDTISHTLQTVEVLGGDLSGSSFNHFTSERELWNPDEGLDREVKNIKLSTPDTLSSIRQSAILLLTLSCTINWRKRFHFKGIVCT